MTSRRSWWRVYGLCAAVVLLALVWITVTVVKLEKAETTARADAARQESLRLALWRMDSWLAPLLAREAARPYFDYQPFYPQQRAYTALLRPINPGEVLTPSPLLSFESELFPIHFQMSPDGTLTSPQAPGGSFRDLAEGAYLSTERIATNAGLLTAVSNLVTREEVSECVAQAEPAASASASSSIPDLLASNAQADRGLQQKLRSQQEASRRKGAYEQAVQEANIGQQVAEVVDRGGESVEVGSLVPFWSAGEGALQLIFTREVRLGGLTYYQGFLCDWPRLRDDLLEQIKDLIPDAVLSPVRGSQVQADTAGTMLATIPVALNAPSPAVAATAVLSPARLTLIITWLAVLAGMVAVAVTLRASIAFGQKRSRFASAVTHELRTPLTTFRMYSEMLADGMVRDPGQRQTYLDTLKSESGRLSSLVENVLAFARLEEGRSRRRPAATTLGRLLSAAVPQLRRRAETAGMSLSVESSAPEDAPLTVDPEAVEQILFNLVDNACKYCADAADRTIHLSAAADDGRITLSVRDHGPGIADLHAASIFVPFERGHRNQGDATAGVGLGLALARGLARDMGGDLRLVRQDGGALFELRL